jgi:hypothetical protein
MLSVRTNAVTDGEQSCPTTNGYEVVTGQEFGVQDRPYKAPDHEGEEDEHAPRYFHKPLPAIDVVLGRGLPSSRARLLHRDVTSGKTLRDLPQTRRAILGRI